jgi:hypothetical protein
MPKPKRATAISAGCRNTDRGKSAEMSAGVYVIDSRARENVAAGRDQVEMCSQPLAVRRQPSSADVASTWAKARSPSEPVTRITTMPNKQRMRFEAMKAIIRRRPCGWLALSGLNQTAIRRLKSFPKLSQTECRDFGILAPRPATPSLAIAYAHTHNTLTVPGVVPRPQHLLREINCRGSSAPARTIAPMSSVPGLHLQPFRLTPGRRGVGLLRTFTVARFARPPPDFSRRPLQKELNPCRLPLA